MVQKLIFHGHDICDEEQRKTTLRAYDMYAIAMSRTKFCSNEINMSVKQIKILRWSNLIFMVTRFHSLPRRRFFMYSDSGQSPDYLNSSVLSLPFHIYRFTKWLTELLYLCGNVSAVVQSSLCFALLCFWIQLWLCIILTVYFMRHILGS